LAALQGFFSTLGASLDLFSLPHVHLAWMLGHLLLAVEADFFSAGPADSSIYSSSAVVRAPLPAAAAASEEELADVARLLGGFKRKAIAAQQPDAETDERVFEEEHRADALQGQQQQPAAKRARGDGV